MRNLVSALALCIAAVFSSTIAHAHCEECPYPLAQFFGEWDTSDPRLTLFVSDLRESKQEVLIEVQLRRRTDGIVVARGRTAVPKNADTIQVRLVDRSGKIQAYYLQLEKRSGDLVMSVNPQLIIEPRCERFRRCIRWRPALSSEARTRPVSNVIRGR